MSSLVTGIGYIGARLSELLLDAGESVVGLDNLFSTDPAALRRLAARPGFTLVRGDVAEESDVRRAFEAGPRIDTVYHLAAQASANPGAAPARYTERANLSGPRVVLEQARASGAAAFVFGSSLQVYGRRVSGLVDESRPYGPFLDLCHLSKLYTEKLMEMDALTAGTAAVSETAAVLESAAVNGGWMRCVAARIGLVYGLSPVMKTDPRFMTAPNKFCLQAARGETLRIDPTGLQPTGMIHVDDAARGLMALARWPRDGFSAVNLPGETASPARVAELLRDLASRRGLEVRIALPEGTPPPPACTFGSALAEHGFEPEHSLATGLPAVLEHFLTAAPPKPRP